MILRQGIQEAETNDGNDSMGYIIMESLNKPSSIDQWVNWGMTTD